MFLGYNVRQNIRHKLCVCQQNLQQPHQRCQLRRLVASTTVLMPLCLLSILYTVFCLQNTANEICFSLFAMYAGYGLLLCATATAAAAVSVMCLTSRYYRRSLPVTPGPQRFPMKILLGLLLTQDCTRQMYFLSAGNTVSQRWGVIDRCKRQTTECPLSSKYYAVMLSVVISCTITGKWHK